MRDRVSCASLKAVAGAGTVLARVLRVDARQGQILLQDDSGPGRLSLPAELIAPEAGDIVAVDVDASGALLALRVLTRYRRDAAFPSPGGEFYRLRGEGLDRVAVLRQRAAVLAALRTFFAGRDYLEIESPLRVLYPGLEPHLVALEAGSGHFLITSPEYQLKRLLAAGLERIYSLGKCFRGDERGNQHVAEFTMLEWYRAYATLDELMDETEALVREVAAMLGADDRLPGAPFARMTVAQACLRHARVDIAGVGSAAELGRRARAAGFDVAEGEGFEEVLSRILVERVEPALSRDKALFLYDYPAPVAALSRLRDDDPTVAERFELYVHGVELANAFGELTDPDEQLARFEADRETRRRAGRPVHQIDQRFIEALREGIPPSAGIALGVDRLIAVLLEVEDVAQTLAFGPEEL